MAISKHLETLESQRNTVQGIFDISHQGITAKILPVETWTYRTINFRENPDYVLYSTALSNCVGLVIRNYNPEMEEYDNIATMAHYFPNNIYDLESATKSVSTALEDFSNAGGKISKNTIIQLLGGGELSYEAYDKTPKKMIENAIRALELDTKCKFTIHDATNECFGETLYVFVSKNGTKITKKGANNDVSPLTEVDHALPFNFLMNVESCLPMNYKIAANTWSRNVAVDSITLGKIPLSKMQDFCNSLLPKNLNR